jgi:hypothetical protein
MVWLQAHMIQSGRFQMLASQYSPPLSSCVCVHACHVCDHACMSIYMYGLAASTHGSGVARSDVTDGYACTSGFCVCNKNPCRGFALKLQNGRNKLAPLVHVLVLCACVLHFGLEM